MNLLSYHMPIKLCRIIFFLNNPESTSTQPIHSAKDDLRLQETSVSGHIYRPNSVKFCAFWLLRRYPRAFTSLPTCHVYLFAI